MKMSYAGFLATCFLYGLPMNQEEYDIIKKNEDEVLGKEEIMAKRKKIVRVNNQKKNGATN